jgi:Kef-type K+ transport system membrane component KefB
MSYGILALIVAVGLLGPLLELLPLRWAPPVVIGEIAAGVAIGRTGTRTIVATQPTLAFLADIGFALLMFIVATELPLRDERIRRDAGRAVSATVVTIGLAIALAPLLAAATGLHRPAVLAVLLASSSAAIVLPIIGTRARDDALLATIGWVSLADVVTVMAVPFVLSTGGFGRALWGAVLVIAGATAVGIVSARLVGLQPVEELRHASHHLAWALDLRLSLLVLFTLAWIAERFGTSVLLAGFAAGVMVSLLGEPRRVADQLIGLGEGFFVPLFFVVLGARLDLRALVHSRDDLLLFALLSVAMALVPIASGAIVRLPLSSGLLATAEMGVPSAVAAIGLATNALRPGQAAAIVGAAAVSLAVAGVGAARLGPDPGVNPPAPDGAG